MRQSRPRAGARISGLAALLFVISTLIVGGLGSAQMWDAGIARTLIPFGRILPVILVAELLAYSALMVGQFGGTLRGRHILLGIVLGLGTRLAEAALAATAHSPEKAQSFQEAFLLYYAQYFPGVLVQIAVTVLLLWLIKGAFAPARATIQPAIRPPESPETLRELEPTRERRRELIEQLMRRESEEESQPEPEHEPPSEPQPETPAPAPAEPDSTPVRFELRPPTPPAVTPEETVAETVSEPQPPSEPPTLEPVEEPAPDVIALPAPHPPATPVLSPREAILQALEDDEPATASRGAGSLPPANLDDEPPNVQLLQPHLALEEPSPEPDFTLAPDAPEITHHEQPDEVPADVPADQGPFLAPSQHGLFTYQVAPGPVAAPVEAEAGSSATWIDAASRALVGVGGSRPAAGETPSGRAVAWALDPGEAGENAPTVLEDILRASAAVLGDCGYGEFTRAFIRVGRKYVGVGAVRGENGGIVAAFTLPGDANLGIADLALGKVAAALAEESLPVWQPLVRPEQVPAYPDEDLQARIAPLFAELPEAAGLYPAASYSPGRQVVILSRRQAGTALPAGDTAALFGLCEELCFCCRLPDCDRVVVAGQAGCVVLGLTRLSGQYLLIALGHPGVPGAAQAGTHLDQLLRGVKRREDAASQPGE